MKREELLKEIAALKKENEILRFALDNIHEGVLITDDQNIIIEYNKEVERTEGKLREDMLGKKEEDAYSNIFNYNFDQLYTKAVLQSGEPIIAAYHEYSLGYGNKTAIMFDVKPVVINGKVVAVCTIGRNINQIKDFIIDTLEMNNKFRQQLGKNELTAKYFFDDIIGESAIMKDLIVRAKKVAKRNSPVLIYGETGTGKELLASSIHNHSLRNNGPFVTLNCAAIPDTLLESTLFGVAKGAFTGAVESVGLFEQANNGTLFLDEINSMPINLQAKLLRSLQEKSVRRIGGSREIPINCRILSASNQSHFEVLEKGIIREDLFYLLSTVELTLPPLRERREDIEYLVGFFLQKYNMRFGLFVENLTVELKDLIYQYDWPGNVRELENFVESSLNLMEKWERQISSRHLSDYFRDKFQNMNLRRTENLREEMKLKMLRCEKEIYEKMLRDYHYNVTNLSKDLGMTRQNIYARLRKLNISLPDNS